jgi:hypothetical protein
MSSRWLGGHHGCPTRGGGCVRMPHPPTAGRPPADLTFWVSTNSLPRPNSDLPQTRFSLRIRRITVALQKAR